MLMIMFDADRSGQLGYLEFEQLFEQAGIVRNLLGVSTDWILYEFLLRVSFAAANVAGALRRP
jgi:hypothetical protein